MVDMEVRLTKPHIQKFVTAQVSAGHFPSPEAVVEDALARMMEEDVVLSVDDVAAIKEADAEFDRGEFIDFDDLAARARRKHVGTDPAAG
jgi:Arc/MetJ-type ribon-helix-helix transcriptional regulator